jgi:hypothetical protein
MQRNKADVKAPGDWESSRAAAPRVASSVALQDADTSTGVVPVVACAASLPKNKQINESAAGSSSMNMQPCTPCKSEDKLPENKVKLSEREVHLPEKEAEVDPDVQELLPQACSPTGGGHDPGPLRHSSSAMDLPEKWWLDGDDPLYFVVTPTLITLGRPCDTDDQVIGLHFHHNCCSCNKRGCLMAQQGVGLG